MNLMRSKYIVPTSLLLILFLFIFSFYQTKKNHMDNNQSLHGLVNTMVTLEGKANDTKIGAVILVDGTHVYVEGLEYWPQDFINENVTLFGKLVVKSYGSKGEIKETGVISQGGDGSNEYILEQATVVVDRGNFGYKRLEGKEGFPQGQHTAIEAIIAELENNKEIPTEFFAKFEPDQTASELSFVLVHQNSFKVENLHSLGNPSGKDKKATYNLLRKKVTFSTFE